MKSDNVELYRDSDTHVTGTADYTWSGKYVKKGQVLELRHLSMVDKTTANKVISLGIQVGNKDPLWLKQVVGTNQNTIYGAALDNLVILVENERPVAKIASPSNQDNVHMAAYGYLYKTE